VRAFIEALHTEGTVMAFQKGKVIVPIGERFRGVYHIMKGKASIRWTDDVVAEIQEGSVFGKVPSPAWHASMTFILMRVDRVLVATA